MNNTIPKIGAISQLFLIIPENEFSAYCMEVIELARKDPEILERIEKDLEGYGKEKKLERIRDKKWKMAQTQNLPSIIDQENELTASMIKLKSGRPRMSGFLVYLFLMIRGYYGGIKTGLTSVFSTESKTLHIILTNLGQKMPGKSTILDNINAVSNETRSYIYDAQIKVVRNEELDNFNELTIDSTSVKANSCWPKDSNLMWCLILRLYTRGKKLHQFGIKDIRDGYFPRILRHVKSLVNKINMESGKPGSKKKRRKHYRHQMQYVEMAITSFKKEMECIKNSLIRVTMLPSQHAKLLRLVEMMDEDLNNLIKIKEYCSKRVFEDLNISSKEKVMSLSDPNAAYIEKGNRDAVIGYKPQLIRSKEGFITSLRVPIGNAADSGQLKNSVQESINRTKVIPNSLSADDGYTHEKTRDELLKIGIKVISFSGSKGKRLISEEDWESSDYCEARNERSAVESLMFTIKHGFNFGKVMRRGIENVRAELLEKVLAYNFCRILHCRRLQECSLNLAA